MHSVPPDPVDPCDARADVFGAGGGVAFASFVGESIESTGGRYEVYIVLFQASDWSVGTDSVLEGDWVGAASRKWGGGRWNN